MVWPVWPCNTRKSETEQCHHQPCDLFLANRTASLSPWDDLQFINHFNIVASNLRSWFQFFTEDASSIFLPRERSSRVGRLSLTWCNQMMISLYLLSLDYRNQLQLWRVLLLWQTGQVRQATRHPPSGLWHLVSRLLLSERTGISWVSQLEFTDSLS